MSALGQQVHSAGRGAAVPDQRQVPEYRRDGSATRPPLRVVSDPVRLRARRRRSRALVISIGVFIAVGMFVIVGAQVVLTQRQIRLDNMGQSLSLAQVTNDQLQLRVANLESPSRIVSEAESQLHMILPTSVVYLTPGAKPASPKVKGLPTLGQATGQAPGQATTQATGSSGSASTTTSGVPG